MGALAWAGAFIAMCATLGGSAFACVFTIEHHKTKRMIEAEKTKRTGMDNMWQLEQAKLSQGQLGSGLSEIEFQLKN